MEDADHQPKPAARPSMPPFGRGLPDVWAMLPHQTVLLPPGVPSGASASGYIWPPKAIPPADELAHVLDLARAAARRKAVLFILCGHAEPLAAIKAAIAETGLVMPGSGALQ
ncbi:hypothetical protein GXW78_06010 [Roseomonas terrae]|uniref:Uncharacterized protein n=1 Tax=Neoroseomonas terrae TaxID=424799 RepID=A0ABS5EDW5_9PROT|nr:hypothetical protein [Neoroseomonas terrae]MBR0649208.1 hypothetical protein [Neoroseomonas terrae]